MEGREEHLPTIEVLEDCLEEEARNEFGRREAGLWPSSFPWMESYQPGRGQQGFKQGEGMLGMGRGQEGRDEPCNALRGPDTFLGATGYPDPFPSLDPSLNQAHFGAGL